MEAVLNGRLVREIYNYNRNVAELWCNAISPEVQGSKRIQALMRETRKRFGSTGLMSNVRTAVQAFGGTNYKLLDQNPLLVGVKDGVYDVESGTTRKGKLEEYVTMSTSVAPDPTADCPTFRKFMKRIFRHDPELIGFMQRWFGYALTGLTTEQVIVFCYGGGQNGKTTLIELMGDIFGSGKDGGYGAPVAAILARPEDVSHQLDQRGFFPFCPPP